MADRIPWEIQRLARAGGFRLELKRLCANPRNRMGLCQNDAGIKGDDINLTPVFHSDLECHSCDLREEWELFLWDKGRHLTVPQIIQAHSRDLNGFTFWAWLERQLIPEETLRRQNRAAYSRIKQNEIARKKAAQGPSTEEQVKEMFPKCGQLIFDGTSNTMTGDKADRRGMV